MDEPQDALAGPLSTVTTTPSQTKSTVVTQKYQEWSNSQSLLHSKEWDDWIERETMYETEYRRIRDSDAPQEKKDLLLNGLHQERMQTLGTFPSLYPPSFYPITFPYKVPKTLQLDVEAKKFLLKAEKAVRKALKPLRKIQSEPETSVLIEALLSSICHDESMTPQHPLPQKSAGRPQAVDWSFSWKLGRDVDCVVDAKCLKSNLSQARSQILLYMVKLGATFGIVTDFKSWDFYCLVANDEEIFHKMGEHMEPRGVFLASVSGLKLDFDAPTKSFTNNQTFQHLISILITLLRGEIDMSDFLCLFGVEQPWGHLCFNDLSELATHN